ncbi:40S ribosomal protein S3 [Ascosphaera acerosa]|nr:40S ribosomal protein S3 [Ascosphaera acerosa]
MIHSGQPAADFIDSATRHVLLRQGVLGIKVKIMRGGDASGKEGVAKALPDAVTILEPKEEQPVLQPISQDYGEKARLAQEAAAAAAAAAAAEEAAAAAAAAAAPAAAVEGGEMVAEYSEVAPVVAQGEVQP